MIAFIGILFLFSICLKGKAIQLNNSLFQCKNYLPGYLSFPNIPDFYFNHSLLATCRVGDSATVTGSGRYKSYLATIPVGCSGKVKSIQICYQVKNGLYDSSQYLRFQAISNLNPSGSTVEITSRPSDNKCSKTHNHNQRNQIVCCEIVQLKSHQYFLLSENDNFTYSVTMLNVGNYRMLRFNATYQIQQLRFQEMLWENFTQIYPDISGMDGEQVSTLLLLRLIMSPEVVSTAGTVKYSDMATPNLLNENSTISESVGAVVALLLVLLAAAFGISILFIVIRKKRRKVFEASHFDNATYGIEKCGLENEIVNPNEMNNTYDQVNHKHCGYEMMYETADEDVYTVPAFDESALDTQFDTFKMLRIPLESMQIGQVLGSGQFGEVHRGLYNTDISVAVKTLREEAKEEDRIKFLQEAAIMGQFRHRNVVTMHGVVTEGNTVMIVLELLLKGDLRGYLLKQKSEALFNVDDHALLSFCHQIASGMAYLSGKGFVHRDLAARNILISDDLICKIADFGMSRDLMYESYYMSHGGMIPVKWTAPEALHYKKYSTASDVWSFGVVMYEIWSVGHKPFEALTNNKVIRVLDSGYRLPPPPGCPRGIYSVMINCWHPEPHKRPSFFDLWRELLSSNNATLLHWTEEDKATVPEALTLGSDLQYSEDLYVDLQATYKT